MAQVMLVFEYCLVLKLQDDFFDAGHHLTQTGGIQWLRRSTIENNLGLNISIAETSAFFTLAGLFFFF